MVFLNILTNKIKKLNIREENGFTLIELLVVILIMAILLAIAIPIFLGARVSAQDRQAQSNINSALTAAKTVYTNNESYNPNSGSLLTALQDYEPAVSYTSGSSTTPNTISFATDATGQSIMLTAQSTSSNCWVLLTIETVNDAAGAPYNVSNNGLNGTSATYPGVTGPGTYYAVIPDATASSTPCQAGGAVATEIFPQQWYTTGFPSSPSTGAP